MRRLAVAPNRSARDVWTPNTCKGKIEFMGLWRSLLTIIAGLLVVSTISARAFAAEIVLFPDSPPDLPVIGISGELQVGDEKKFAQIALPLEKALVVFDSPGGNLWAGISIGKAIRLKEFGSLVDDGRICASACGLAWLGGSPRLAHPNARIGFHAAYEDKDGTLSEKGLPNALVGAYLNQLGMSQSTIMHLTSASPEQMLWLPLAEARPYGIEVEILQPSKTTETEEVSPPNSAGPEVTRSPETATPGSLPSTKADPLKTTVPEKDPSRLVASPDRSPSSDDDWFIVTLPGFDMWGADLDGMPIRAGSASECETNCFAETRCKAFTYNVTSSVCFLKSDGARLLRNRAAVAGYTIELKGKVYVSPFEVLEGTDIAGNDFQELKTSDFELCLSACEADPRCMAFTFTKRGSGCWLKTEGTNPQQNKRAISGVRVTPP